MNTMIFLIITTCLYNIHGHKNDEVRIHTYMSQLHQTLPLVSPEIRVIIVENSTNPPTCLDVFSHNIPNVSVYYTQNNNDPTKTEHKGMTELADIHDVMRTFGIVDDDIVIKLTGRYGVLSPDFFEFVIGNNEKYDAFLKFYNVCTLQFMEKDCVLGLYALRAKYVREFKYATGNHNAGSMEVQFATYVRSVCSPQRICEIPYLNMKCIFADDMRIQHV